MVLFFTTTLRKSLLNDTPVFSYNYMSHPLFKDIRRIWLNQLIAAILLNLTAPLITKHPDRVAYRPLLVDGSCVLSIYTWNSFSISIGWMANVIDSPAFAYSTSQKFGHTFSFNGFSLFFFISTLQINIEDFQTMKDMFYISDSSK